MARTLKKGEVDSILVLAWSAHVAIFTYILLARYFSVGGSRYLIGILFEGAFTQWDVRHYFSIARIGYEVDQQIVFYPGFPALVAVVRKLLFTNELYAALVLNFAAHVAGSGFLYLLLRLDEDEQLSRRALLFSLVFPTAIFTVVPYTEALFLCCATGSMYFFRTHRFKAAGLFGFFAMLSRPAGLAVIAMLAVEYWSAMRRHVAWREVVFALVCPCMGAGAILVINFAYHGDAFYFMTQTAKIWDKHLALPHIAFAKSWEIFRHRAAPEDITRGFSELLGVALACITCVYATLRLRRSYAVFSILSSAIFIFQTNWESALRYVFAVFPLFIVLAKISKNEVVRYLLISFSVVYMALLVGQWVKGSWVQ